MAKNRTIIGIICILLAFAVLLVALPLINTFSDKKVTIVRPKVEISQGHQILPEELEEIDVKVYNLPDDALHSIGEVQYKFATCNIKPGDYIFSSKISESAATFNDVVYSLKNNETMLTISAKNDALARYLENGDVIELLFDGNLKENGKDLIVSYKLDAIRFVRIIALFANGVPREKRTVDESGTYAPPDEIGIVVTIDQADLIQKLNATGAIKQINYRLRAKHSSPSSAEFIKWQNNQLQKIFGSDGGDHTFRDIYESISKGDNSPNIQKEIISKQEDEQGTTAPPANNEQQTVAAN